MNNESQNSPIKKSKNGWKSYWPLGIVVALVLIGWYLAAGSSLFDSQAAGSRDETTRTSTSSSTTSSRESGSSGSSSSTTTSTPSRPVVDSHSGSIPYTPRGNPTSFEEAEVITPGNQPLRFIPGGAVREGFQLSTAYNANLTKLNYKVRAPVGYEVIHVEHASSVYDNACGVDYERSEWRESRTDGTETRKPFVIYRRYSPASGSIALTEGSNLYYCFRVVISPRSKDGGQQFHGFFATKYPMVAKVKRASHFPPAGLFKSATTIKERVFDRDPDSPGAKPINSTVLIGGGLQVRGVKEGTSWERGYPMPATWVRITGMHEEGLAKINYHTVARQSQCTEASFNSAANSTLISEPKKEFFLRDLENDKYCMRIVVSLPNSGNQPARIFPTGVYYLDATSNRNLTYGNHILNRAYYSANSGWLDKNGNRVDGNNEILQGLSASLRSEVDRLTNTTSSTPLQVTYAQANDNLEVRVHEQVGEFWRLSDGSTLKTEFHTESLKMGKINTVEHRRTGQLTDLNRFCNATGSFIAEEVRYSITNPVSNKQYWLPITVAERGARYCFKTRTRLTVTIKPAQGAERKYTFYEDATHYMRHGLNLPRD